MYFTVCIPIYNRAHTIVRTLDSLERQCFKDFEILMIDDGSEDNLREVLDEWKQKNTHEIRYIHKENGGKHSALNVGIHNAEGKFFMILDSDDWLVDNALEKLHELCTNIEEDDKFSGVMVRSLDIDTNQMVGEAFKESPMVSSYVDYHFVLPFKMDINDCFECNKTNILRQYHFPEDENTKFVPEAWLFDQVGLNYKLYCTNDILRYIEYQEDGITLTNTFKQKNIVGYLYHYISRIENVLPNVKVPKRNYVIAWWRYWDAVKKDKEKLGPRCKKITFLGRVVRVAMPFINVVYRVRYKEYYKAGR